MLNLKIYPENSGYFEKNEIIFKRRGGSCEPPLHSQKKNFCPLNQKLHDASETKTMHLLVIYHSLL